MGRIRRLDPLVQSQIAAGEVVERPASVVKELVENSLDAGAHRISVDFLDSGLSLIRVSDDGCGMDPDDAAIALERFATSKLQGSEDLDAIATLGFRGEALPSIASVSRLCLETRTCAGAPTLVRAEAGQVTAVEERGLPAGTTVAVQDLFFNTPARLKFMKSKTTEKQAIVEVVVRLALSWPHVSFTLRSGDNVILRTAGQGLRNALSDVFGPADASRMVAVEGTPGISGFVGLPSLYRRSRDRQIFSVNSRPVRNSSLGWALDQAYAGLLPQKSYAVAVLDFAVPAAEVDVNVHPAKAEVKFQNERELRSRLWQAVSRSLSGAGFALSGLEPREPNAKWLREPGAQSRQGYSSRRPDTGGDIHWELVRDVGPEPLATDPRAPEPSGWEYLGSLQDTYLVAKTPSSLLLVDKHALMESLTFASLAAGTSGSQELLVSEIVRLGPKEAVAYEESQDVLKAVGFGSRLVGDRTVMVTAVPLVLGSAAPPASIRDVLARLAEGIPGDPVRALEAARLETAACHASVRARESMTASEAHALLSGLRDNPSARTCPHGRPTVREVSLKELGEFFGRRQSP